MHSTSSFEPIEQLKSCSRCGIKQPLVMFTSDRKQSDGFDRTCRTCNAQRIRCKKTRYIAAGRCADCGANRDSSSVYCDRCAARHVAGQRLRDRALRLELMHRYSRGRLECVCCGESKFEFLTLDHVNNDGKAHRRRCKTIYGVYRDLKRRGFPPVIQIMCFNCNMGREPSGICPHVRAHDCGVRNETVQHRYVSDVTEPDKPRRCTCCNHLVPRGAYYRDPGGPGGLQSRCGSCTREAALDRLRRIRDVVFAHYGGGNIRCVCCSENMREFLALDHVMGGGTAARRSAGSAGTVIYVLLKKQGFPPGLRILCHNCNCAKRDGRDCPHNVVT
jgi:hypothetical protein